AIEGELDDARGKRGGGQAVVAVEALDDEGVVGRFGAGDVDRGRESEDGHRVACAEDVDDVVAVRAVDGDDVGGGLAGAAADGAGEADIERGEAGAGEAVDGDVVDAAESVEVDAFETVDVHRDIADVACEFDALAVGGDDKLFAGGAAI